ncbi:MAG: transcriptional regulator GcvA [Hyphomicrobiaceae bacterium]|nr:MAG: transcriptional regulator GcvA [Hyphomicrobiaceae bacterium]
MRRRLPPLKTLPAFEIAADRLSFSAAAGELNLTHGAVSRQIKALENHLGEPLFRRHNRRIELTDTGKALLPAVRQALHLLETSSAHIAAERKQGPLVVSCLATFLMRWLIPRLYDFKALHPEIEVRLAASHAPVDFARDGVDVAIRLGKPPWPANVVAQPFHDDLSGPVCSPALLQGRRLKRPSELRRYALLHTDTRPHAWSEWLDAKDETRVDAARGLRFEHTYFLLEAAASGLGVAVGSRALVEQDLKAGRLIAPFGFSPSGRAYTVLCSRQAARLPKVKAFRSWIADTAAKITRTP